jgi:hypothetical protein
MNHQPLDFKETCHQCGFKTFFVYARLDKYSFCCRRCIEKYQEKKLEEEADLARTVH